MKLDCSIDFRLQLISSKLGFVLRVIVLVEGVKNYHRLARFFPYTEDADGGGKDESRL